MLGIIARMNPSTIAVRLAILVVLIAAAGCSVDSKKDVTTSSTNAPISIEPGVSVGKVRAGMTTQQVVGELGMPEFANEYYLLYRRYGFTVTLKDGVVYGVICGNHNDPQKRMPMAFAGRTREGIGMGSSRTDVIKVYGEAEVISTNPALKREELYYPRLRLLFYFQDGRVECIDVSLENTK